MAEITLRGASAHNLHNLDLTLPLGRWIALTGPSGSGKTTLAMDVLHREGQRRYLGALSSKARQYTSKLGAAEVQALRGLPVTLATGQGALTPSPRSTVGTLTGLLDLLRLWFAREAEHDGGPLTRSHFSFNHDVGACSACKGLGVEDQVAPELLVKDPAKSLRDGALVPTLPNGYTVYSQVTVEVMDSICRAHGFDVDTPWAQLSEEQQHVIFFGTRALEVPFGKHSLESRMKWEGITARPREVGYYRGLIPVIEETLARDRNPNILRFVRSVPCSSCGGTRLGPVGRQARLGSCTLPELLALPLRDLGAQLDGLPSSAVGAALRPSLDLRLRRLSQLSLGHLALDRESTTLSGGEGQRLRLASQLAGGLGGQLLVLDEPTLGLHPEAQPGMAAVLEELRALGNTLLVVDHDPHMVQRADHQVDLGPGAGPHGGRVVYAGPMRDGALAHVPVPRREREDAGFFVLRGARLHNLQRVDLRVALGAMTVVSGPSGAGKSSLVFGTLLPAVKGEPAQCDGVEGLPRARSVRWIDARPIGRTPRSTPATYTGLFDLVRKRFAALPEAKARKLTASRFSYNTKAGRCAGCEGMGVQSVGLHLLQDVEQTCVVCGGSRYAPEVLAVTLRGLDIGAVLQLTVEEACAFFAEDDAILPLCTALLDLGLGYLQLGQASNTLSRGEAQRVRLATLLGKRVREPSLLLLDEPDRGLHPDDIVRLLGCLGRLLDAGHTLVVVSHHPMLWQAADHRVGLREGRLAEPCPVPDRPALTERVPAPPPRHIALRGVRTHNLADLDVDLPHGAITAVTGPSGSGKSSLVVDTLAALAWGRFAESLPFQVRRFVRQLPAPDLDEATGLTPVLLLQQGQGQPGSRSTVGTLTELDAGLRLLWSRLGGSGLTASYFSPNQAVGACPACAGLGTVSRCDPERLITHPELPLGEGAMAGTKPGAFFGEPSGQYLQTLAVAAEAAGLDVSGPWRALSEAARHLALHGAGEAVFEVSWEFSRGKRSGTHHFEGTWPGLLALVENEARVRAKRKNAAEWAAPLAPRPCPACDGERLSPEARAVTVGGLRLPTVQVLELGALRETLATLAVAERAVVDAIVPELLHRLDTLLALGLGHLSLSRRGPSLSAGELQRLRLATVLDSELSQLTLVLDEPGAGLDDARLHGLVARLRAFCAEGNTVVMVSHRDVLVQGADHVLTLGPGAGAEGGRLVQAGPPAPMPERPPLRAQGELVVRGACAHNLRGFELVLPDRGLVAVHGPSGSGKSTLLSVLGDSSPDRAVGCAAIEGLERFDDVVRTVRTRRRSPLSTLGLDKAFAALFHSVGSGLSRSSFSFHSAAGRCPACQGSGTNAVAMDFLADVVLDCAVCGGARFRPEVLAVRWQGLNPAEVLATPVAQLLPLLPKGALARACQALCALGLGHLALGRRGQALSYGEHQRVALAGALARPGTRTLWLLDEPGSGLHRGDLARLLAALYRLVDQGALVVLTTHRQALVDGAHVRVALGPGGGHAGGALL